MSISDSAKRMLQLEKDLAEANKIFEEVEAWAKGLKEPPLRIGKDGLYAKCEAILEKIKQLEELNKSFDEIAKWGDSIVSKADASALENWKLKMQEFQKLTEQFYIFEDWARHLPEPKGLPTPVGKNWLTALSEQNQGPAKASVSNKAEQAILDEYIYESAYEDSYDKETIERAERLNKSKEGEEDWDGTNRRKNNGRRKDDIDKSRKLTNINMITTLRFIVDILRGIWGSVRKISASAAQSYTDSITGLSLGLTAKQIRDYRYFDKAKGLSDDTSIKAMKAVQSKFIDLSKLEDAALKAAALIMGDDTKAAINLGLGRTRPDELMKLYLTDAYNKYLQGIDLMGRGVGREKSAESLIEALNSVSPELGSIFNRMIYDSKTKIYANANEWYAEDLGIRSVTEEGANAKSEIGALINVLKARAGSYVDKILTDIAISVDGILTFLNNIDFFMSPSEKEKAYDERLEKNAANKEKALNNLLAYNGVLSDSEDAEIRKAAFKKSDAYSNFKFTPLGILNKNDFLSLKDANGNSIAASYGVTAENYNEYIKAWKKYDWEARTRLAKGWGDPYSWTYVSKTNEKIDAFNKQEENYKKNDKVYEIDYSDNRVRAQASLGVEQTARTISSPVGYSVITPVNSGLAYRKALSYWGAPLHTLVDDTFKVLADKGKVKDILNEAERNYGKYNKAVKDEEDRLGRNLTDKEKVDILVKSLTNFEKWVLAMSDLDFKRSMGAVYENQAPKSVEDTSKNLTPIDKKKEEEPQEPVAQAEEKENLGDKVIRKAKEVKEWGKEQAQAVRDSPAGQGVQETVKDIINFFNKDNSEDAKQKGSKHSSLTPDTQRIDTTSTIKLELSQKDPNTGITKVSKVNVKSDGTVSKATVLEDGTVATVESSTDVSSYGYI